MQENFVAKLNAYFNERERQVNENRESPELAALMLQIFALGLLSAAEVSGFKVQLNPKLKELTEKLDPYFTNNQMLRMKAQHITLKITPDQPD